MIPEVDPDLATYLSELLRTNKSEHQSNTFWFPTPENPGKTEIIPQYRQESSKNCANCNRKKN